MIRVTECRPSRRIFALAPSSAPNDIVSFIEVALVPQPSSSVQVGWSGIWFLLFVCSQHAEHS
jgi:hypothetical protein